MARLMVVPTARLPFINDAVDWIIYAERDREVIGLIVIIDLLFIIEQGDKWKIVRHFNTYKNMNSSSTRRRAQKTRA